MECAAVCRGWPPARVFTAAAFLSGAASCHRVIQTVFPRHTRRDVVPVCAVVLANVDFVSALAHRTWRDDVVGAWWVGFVDGDKGVVSAVRAPLIAVPVHGSAVA